MTGRNDERKNPFDPRLFRPEAISAETRAFNDALRKQAEGRPKMWEDLGPNGKPRGFPPAPRSPRARTFSVDVPGAPAIALRVLAPDNPKGVYLHLHAGGLVIGSADAQDPLLERIADGVGLACVSVEYRLAPEHPYPAAWDDCEAAALWLAKNAKSEFGTNALSIGGESAGATLAVPTLVRMRDRHGFTGFKAANLSYGNYDTSMTPSQKWLGENGFLLHLSDISRCSDAYAPDVTTRRNPDMSALYANVRAMPPALFTVGTLDPFLDDSLFLYARWIAAGNEAELAVFPGAPHGFNLSPHPLGAEANARIDAFLKGWATS
jgi:acetyl esterase/lipase